MNPQTVADWVVHAGWTGTDAVTAGCVAMAGSGDQSPAGLFGLGSSGDGNAQAMAAHDAWSARGWGIFPNYVNGRWRLMVPIMTAPVAAALLAETPPAQKAADVVAPVVNTVTSTADAASQAAHTLAFLSTPGGWQRIVKIAVGGALIVGAALYIAKRETFDQGVRMLRFVGRNADFIAAARSAGAGRTAQVSSSSSSSSSTSSSTPPPKPPAKKITSVANRRPRSGQAATAASTHTTPGRHAAPKMGRPNIAAASAQVQSNPAWSNAPTQAHKVVGTAKAPPRKLPGDSATAQRRRRT